MAVVVTIDGTTVPTVAGTVTPRLNRPSQGQVRVPMHLASGGAGSKIKVVIDGVIALHGRCTFCETTAEEDTGYTLYNITDPLELWEKRPARDGAASGDAGDFSNPTFMHRVKYGPQIMEEILVQSLDGSDPADGEGPADILLGNFYTGGVSLEGAPTDWPMTIAEIASLLVSTGQLDILAVPIDDGTNMARIDCYNGNYGTDRSGTLSFDYGMGAYNVRSLKWTEDLSTVINKLWTYLGPRRKTLADPGAVQHWAANITGTYAFPDPPKSAVLARRDQSRLDYLVRMVIEIFDAGGEETVYAKDLYVWNWLAESWAAAVPQELVHITPVRGLTFGQFGVGDLVAVRATSAVRGGFSGVQRVYEYTASWDQDSVLTIGELQTSPQNEGF